MVRSLLAEKHQQLKQVLAAPKDLQVAVANHLKYHLVALLLKSQAVAPLKHHRAALLLKSQAVAPLKHHLVALLLKSQAPPLKHHRAADLRKKEIYLLLLNYLQVEGEKEEKEADLQKHPQSQGHSQKDPLDLRVAVADLLKHRVHNPLEGEKKQPRRQVAV